MPGDGRGVGGRRVACWLAVAIVVTSAVATASGPVGGSRSFSAGVVDDRVDAPDDPLDHPLRQRLFEEIQTAPGTYPAALVEATGEPRSTVRYHVRVLVDAGLVRVVERTGKRHLVPASLDEREAELAVARADDATAAVLETLAHDGPLSVSRLAARLDRSPSTVSHHLRRLEDRGLVDRTRRGHAAVSALPSWVGAED